MYALGMCVDEGYWVPALVVLNSAAGAIPFRERRNVPVRIITTGLSRAQGDTLAAVTRRLGFHSFDIRLETPHSNCLLIHGPYITLATYLRFSFTREFVSRPFLAYLDADLLVLDQISAPFERVTENRIGLVRDAVNHTIGRGPALPGVVERWPSLRGREYFNAGVFWIATDSLKHLRAGIHQVLVDSRRHIHFNDQDALNLWAARSGAALSIDTAYNAFEMGRFRERGDWIYRMAQSTITREPSIVHFIGPEKPWHGSCPTTEAVRVYRSYLREVFRQISRVGDRTAYLNDTGVTTN